MQGRFMSKDTGRERWVFLAAAVRVRTASCSRLCGALFLPAMTRAAVAPKPLSTQRLFVMGDLSQLCFCATSSNRWAALHHSERRPPAEQRHLSVPSSCCDPLRAQQGLRDSSWVTSSSHRWLAVTKQFSAGGGCQAVMAWGRARVILFQS